MSLKTCISTSDKLLIGDEIIFLVEKAYLKIVYKELRDGMVTSLTAQLNFNAYFFYDTNAKKFTARHIVLPWIQRRANFSIKY